MDHTYSVSEFVALTNQLLESAFPFVRIAGEVSNFKISQDKWVTFRLSDGESIVDCFMTVWNMRRPLEDGMNVIVAGNPVLKGKFGKFSVTVQQAVPQGEGALQRAFELLRKKLLNEGLFDETRKRPLPNYPMHIGVISSEQADGYKDFETIAGKRWPLAKITLAQSTVQGESAPDQLIAALNTLNQLDTPPEVIAIVRGGGSAEDLQAFNDEHLVRSVATSRVPVVSGVGHENDTTLVDLAADKRTSTPSNAAETITPDIQQIKSELVYISQQYDSIISNARQILVDKSERMYESVSSIFKHSRERIDLLGRVIHEINPQRIFDRGYAAVTLSDGTVVSTTEQLKNNEIITVRVKDGSVKIEGGEKT